MHSVSTHSTGPSYTVMLLPDVNPLHMHRETFHISHLNFLGHVVTATGHEESGSHDAYGQRGPQPLGTRSSAPSARYDGLPCQISTAALLYHGASTTTDSPGLQLGMGRRARNRDEPAKEPCHNCTFVGVSSYEIDHPVRCLEQWPWCSTDARRQASRIRHRSRLRTNRNVVSSHSLISRTFPSVYTFGRETEIYTDYKPLEPIVKRPFAQSTKENPRHAPAITTV